MSFTVDTYRPDYLESMLARFNVETAGHPHVAPLTPERFVALVERKSYFDPTGLFVAHAGGEVLGWAHACCAPATETWSDTTRRRGLLRMLIFSADRLDVGHALVAEATAWLARTGETALLALHAEGGYPFYRGLWYGGEPMGPATMPHVQVTLAVAGYQNTQESIFMAARWSAAPEVPALARIELYDEPADLSHNGKRESWVGFTPMQTHARLGDAVVGSIGWTVLPHMAEKLGAPCLSVWSMGVAEQHRRKGIASTLLAHAIRESYAQGARFGSVATQLWNRPAQATYAKYGFAPNCLLIGRTRQVDPTEGK